MSTEDKLDRIVERVASIDTTLKFQAQQLETHIKRTELLETRIMPIEDHVKFIQGALRLVIYLSSCSALIALIVKLIRK